MGKNKLLKRCPFCGSNDISTYGECSHCKECGARGPVVIIPMLAQEGKWLLLHQKQERLWNRRVAK